MSEGSRFSAARTILLTVWGLFCLLPIIFFATIALIAFILRRLKRLLAP